MEYIWIFSELRRYKTDDIDKKQLFRIIIHKKKKISKIITAKRNLHIFSLQLFSIKCVIFLSLIFGTKMELYLK